MIYQYEVCGVSIMTTINKIVRTGVLGGLLMGAVTLNSTNPIKNTDKIPNQTEVVSKEGAAALRAASLQGVQQASVPDVHNQKLDKALRKYIESADDREYIDGIINNTYKDNGTYLASALMQHEINLQHLCSFMCGNTDILIKNNINPELGRTIKGFGAAFYKTVTPREEMVIEWLMNGYSPSVRKSLQFDRKPTAEEVATRLDNIAKTKSGFTRDELIEYYALNDEFIYKKLKKRNNTQAMSDLIAYKMFLIDKMMFEKELDGIGVFTMVGRFENQKKTIYDYYQEWIKSVEPIAD